MPLSKEANFEDWLYDCPILEKDCTDEWVEKDKMGNDVKVVCYYFKIPKESKNDQNKNYRQEKRDQAHKEMGERCFRYVGEL